MRTTRRTRPSRRTRKPLSRPKSARRTRPRAARPRFSLDLPVKTQEQIEARNKLFEALSPAEKRVAIAQDVLDGLRRGFYTATPGTYCHESDPLKNRLRDLDVGQQIQPVLLKAAPKCQVCAVGSCMVSAIRLGNDEKQTYSGQDGELPHAYNTAGKHFSYAQLNLMERCFEESGIDDRKIVAAYFENKAQERAAELALRFPKAKDRLAAIMKNIIRNKGEFKP